jgi:hypothetical protein
MTPKMKRVKEIARRAKSEHESGHPLSLQLKCTTKIFSGATADYGRGRMLPLLTRKLTVGQRRHSTAIR